VLFNSPVFLFAFLPVTFALFFLIGRFSPQSARLWLTFASLFFYAWWNPPYVLLLLMSATFNYAVGQALQRRSPLADTTAARKLLLYVGLTFNIVFLGYFKYFAFLLSTVTEVTGHRFETSDIVLPLAISFYTFQKIAYLVDSFYGKVKEKSFLNYLLFVAFFPQLIAGPIVHYSEVFPQFRDLRTYRLNAANVADGLTIFLLGLAKKVVLADEFARNANAGFNSAASGTDVSFIVAWIAVLAYSLQLYFDFSGYSDMAIGLARMFNLRLPLNFNAPYQATNIIEFWRRWHMTLSRFLRDYVYISLGGNRLGLARRYANVLLTMVIGGLWHGAAWTFVLWGTLHGCYLLVNHFWRTLTGARQSGLFGSTLAHVLTLFAVVFAWVLFRSTSLDAAFRLYKGMFGWNGALFPEQILAVIPSLRAIFVGVGNVPGLADSSVMGTVVSFVMLGLGIGIVLFAPTLYQVSQRTRLALVALSFAFTFQKVVFSSDISPFLYFQF
jgi:alginate O-acetyltransferase complex protein AlgI